MKIPPNLIYIFKDENKKIITMQDILDGKISKINAYKLQVNEWYFKPIKFLGVNTETFNIGMSMFLLEIVFFESHGQFLRGRSSKSGSSLFFEYSFEKFLEFLISKGRLDESTLNMLDDNFYNKIRCGLFHDGYIKDGFLVDSTKSQDKSFYKDSLNRYDGWLVNPWELIKDIEGYFDDYIKQLEKNEDSILYKKFNKMFDIFFYTILKK